MSSICLTTNENIINDESSKGLPSNLHNSKKCLIRKKIGIITPQFKSDFISSQSQEKSEKKDNEMNQYNSPNNLVKINVATNIKINWDINPFSDLQFYNKENKEPNKPSFNSFQDSIRIIDKDSVESFIPCKPMINSTSSKKFMLEYSQSKKYKEDLKNLKLSNSVYSSSINKNNNTPSTDSRTEIIEEAQKEKEEDSFDDIEELLKYQEEHLPVPIKEKDNENFKILTMKKMKRPSLPPNKSVGKLGESLEPLYEKEFRITNTFFKLRRKKVVHSTRRIYSSNYTLKKGKKKFDFKIFRDKDIGVYEYWQTHIHESHNDEDAETDDEQKNLAKCFTLGEIKEAFTFIKSGNFENTFVNFNRFNKYMSPEENQNIKIDFSELKKKLFYERKI